VVTNTPQSGNKVVTKVVTFSLKVVTFLAVFLWLLPLFKKYILGRPPIFFSSIVLKLLTFATIYAIIEQLFFKGGFYGRLPEFARDGGSFRL
jgi:hypothetical protein